MEPGVSLLEHLENKKALFYVYWKDWDGGELV